ncbi:STAS domain-containing protein [Streptomyces sp. PLM4]|uniref:STAS domain-containing protein n=1 Tax=Streptomyces sp. PLM4 TaxID=2929798 RepID=UPI002052B788|nr:STAS domain-containing protein [Streptomyces sp. PLM4]BDH71754.1 anti-sigma factor antagonist [Streptomyces sp. PLM4]
MAQLTVAPRTAGDVTLLGLAGKITISGGDVELREALDRQLDDGARKLLLDLREVTGVDSAGIGELVRSLTRSSNRDGSLKLLHPSPKLRDLLTVTQLITAFDVFDDEDEAVKSFA